MRKIAFLFLFALIIVSKVTAADRYLLLDHTCASTHMGFDKVNIIDMRIGNPVLGFVQVGAFNRMEELRFEGSFKDSLAKFFLQPNSSMQSGRELTILLYEFFVSEQTGGISETGRFKLSMRLFENLQGQKLQEILMVDSAYAIYATDATSKVLRSVNERLCEISSLLTRKKAPNQNLPAYTVDELNHLDSIEKLQIPIYNTDKFKTGIFVDYEHFKNNDPDSAFVSYETAANGKIHVFRWNNQKKKREKLEVGSFYAAFDGDKLVKSTESGIYYLEKIGLDFYFTGKSTYYGGMSSAVIYGFMFGLTGLVVASALDPQKEQVFKLRINYRTGHSVPVSLAD